jgi:hypothetical protein
MTDQEEVLMGRTKNVTIKVSTATAEAKALPPKIITVKNFLRWNWKYIGLTWASTVAIALIGCFLPWPLSPKFSIVLSIVPFFLGTRAITKHTITEITN